MMSKVIQNKEVTKQLDVCEHCNNLGYKWMCCKSVRTKLSRGSSKQTHKLVSHVLEAYKFSNKGPNKRLINRLPVFK